MTPTAIIRAAGATHSGISRDNNEDTFEIAPHRCAAILADGMGGHQCGEAASAITVASVLDYLASPERDLTPQEIAMEAIRAANREVISAAKTRAGCDGMGSTIVLALWALPDIVIANVGDSRAYLLRNGELKQLSYDQNFANELRTKLGFSEERLRHMPNRNVLTMAVGSFEHVLVRTHTQTLSPGDIVLICSDGLYGPVSHDEIVAIMDMGGTLQEQVENLIDAANRNGGPDNVTVVLLEYGEENG